MRNVRFRVRVIIICFGAINMETLLKYKVQYIFGIAVALVFLVGSHSGFLKEKNVPEGNQDDFLEEIIDLIEEVEAEEHFFAVSEETDFFQEEDVIEKVALPVAPSKPSVPRGYIAPGIVASVPATYKKDSLGRMVCEKRKDKPGISTQDKPVHIDMECCLDPDEIPNPFCYYHPERYGKLLSDYERKKEKFFRKYFEKKKL